MLRSLETVLAVLALAGCGGGSHHAARGAVSAKRSSGSMVTTVERHAAGGIAFIIGVSTDPYGTSQPTGFGVATGLAAGKLRFVEERVRGGPSALAWLGTGRLLVGGRTAVRGPTAALYAFGDGRLLPLGGSPLRPAEAIFAWSPNLAWIATQPSLQVSCGPGAVVTGCTTAGDRIFVERADGSHRHLAARGQLRGWVSNDRLLLFRGDGAQFNAGALVILDLRSGMERALLSSREVAAYAHARQAKLGDLAYSADGRYLAILAWLPGNNGVGIRTIVIARADGSIVRMISSTAIISMLAWSPRGEQLAYTTSGFPAPHELYVLASPHAHSWRVLSQGPHFDWVTWSPDDHWLLIDNEHLHGWDLLRLTGHTQAAALSGAAVPITRLPRLGGEPLWCCPQEHYAGT